MEIKWTAFYPAPGHINVQRPSLWPSVNMGTHTSNQSTSITASGSRQQHRRQKEHEMGYRDEESMREKERVNAKIARRKKNVFSWQKDDRNNMISAAPQQQNWKKMKPENINRDLRH